MPPSNIDAEHAIEITSIPYMTLLSAADVQSSPGTDHPLWWKWTNPANKLFNIYALGSLLNFTYPIDHRFNVPIIAIYTGTPDSLTLYPPALPLNDAVSMQVFTGIQTTFYIKVTVDGAGHTSEPVQDPLWLRVLPGTNITAQLGSWMITNDSVPSYWPTQIFGSDGHLKQSASIVSAEVGYMFDDGSFAVLDESSHPEPLVLYASDFTLVATVPIAGGATSGAGGDDVTGDGTSTVFVGKSTTSVAAVITSVNKDTGAVGSTWTLPANSKLLKGTAVSRDRTIFYYRAGATSNAIHRYDLIGSAPLSDLVANDGRVIILGLSMLKDGTLIAGFGDGTINRYDSSGALLNTYTLPSDVGLNLISPYIDDPDSIVAWTFIDGANDGSHGHRFFLIDTASGDVSQLGADVPGFDEGLDSAAINGLGVSNAPKFGIPVSCPLLVPRVKLAVPDTPPVASITAPLPCCDIQPGVINPGPVEEPITPEWIAQCRGGGQVPEAADITDAEDWAA